MSDELPEVFAAACDYGWSLGMRGIDKLPGCWESQVDEHWKLVFNGHGDHRRHDNVTIPPYSIYIEFNGWPAGFVNAGGGQMAAGSIANENELIAALRKATKSA